MNFLLPLLFAQGAIAAQPEPDPELYAEIAGWSVYQDQDNTVCRAINLYEDNEFVLVQYDARTKNSIVSFTNKNSTSLKENDKRQIRLYFIVNGELDDGWGELTFTAWVREDGSRVLRSNPLNPPLLEDFAKASTIAFFYGEKLIGSYSLKSSAQVARSLRGCAMKVAGINPRDPFAN